MANRQSKAGGWSTPNTDLDAIMTWVIGCCPPAPPRPRCGCCCGRCGCWMHRRRGARRLQDEHCGSGSTTPYSIAGHSDTHVSVTSKMYVLLQSVHVSGAQTSQLASLQDAHYGYVSTTPYSVARHPETRVPPRPRCRCCCCRCRCWTGRRRSSRRCKMSLAGQCHAAVLGRRARRDARPRRVQDVGAAAVGARTGRTEVAARVAAR